jgi:hypothetical protein
MKNISRRKSKKILLIAAIVATLIVVAGTWFVLKKFNSNDQSGAIDYNPPTTEQLDAGSQTKEKSVNTDKPTTSGSDTPPAPVPSNGSSKSTVEVSMTASSQNGNTYQIRYLISTVVDSGTCTLTLTKGAQAITKSAGVQPQSSTSTCQGFDIPTNELTAGQWQAVMSFENDRLQGTTTSTIMVQ